MEIANRMFDVLRYQTFVMTPAGHRKQTNKTEMERILWQQVIAHGYAPCYTTEPQARRINPQEYLVQFTRA